ncbi:homocysteine S-methyltransferase family protein [Fluviicola sp.]|jgi:5-methyltetrahydrofolate--homocysteine methyltransferase|uniref:homocysteine S-methyltransferase family protein n=1 Tax=Fluviicola sp. TaxID=1917219 RepID=UPI00283872D3|nr:homocysteine S-methyltransferase family protein [Fluviicola sp.]MDR0801356.1 homocysteine S-methyltransferase family protein [Fluviicola sp.]
MKDIRQLINERILILDGAMGTMIQHYNLKEEDFRKGWFEDHPHKLKGDNDILVLTQPDIIEEIHTQYLEAGSDIIETNTFGATSVAQADYYLEKAVYDINYHGAKIARKVCDEFTAKNPDKPRFVAGSMGPTTKLASMSPDLNDPGFRAINFNELVIAFKEQATGLIDGGADFLLVETITDTLNAKAAMFAIDELSEERSIQIPIMISGTITDQSGRMLTGQTTEAFLVSVSHMPLLSIGLNCALGADAMRPYLQILANQAPFAVSAHPNAGLPNEFGQYDETPDMMGTQIEDFLREGLINIIGGCCGTTPGHIRKMAEIASKYSPRKISETTNA